MKDTVPSPDQNHKLLSIGAVVGQLRRSHPEVTHSSLRFLEREGLLVPKRTIGGHRLYEPSDVRRVLQIKRWQAQRLTLQEIRQRLAEQDRLVEPSNLLTSFVECLAHGELGKARSLVLSADEAGVPLSELFGDVLQPALTEVGVRWEHGQMLVSQEKEISELSRDLIAELSLRHTPHRATGPTIVAGGVEGELHELGLRMICGLLRAHGFDMRYLGANVAPRFLLEAVRRYQPQVILLSARLSPNLPAVKDAIDYVRDQVPANQLPRVIVGGEIVGQQPEAILAWGAIPMSGLPLDQIPGAIANTLHTFNTALK